MAFIMSAMVLYLGEDDEDFCLLDFFFLALGDDDLGDCVAWSGDAAKK